MSTTILVGFFLFWLGVALSAVAIRAAIATPTRGEALVWLAGGVASSCILLLAASAYEYSPPGSSRIIAYVILTGAIGVAVYAAHKPKEEEDATENSRQ